MREGRTQTKPSGQLRERALLGLACDRALASGNLTQAYRRITETATGILKVARAGIWMLQGDRNQILRCADLFELKRKRHTSGTELRAKEYPAYFKALKEHRAIVANDAVRNPATREFKAGYLEPLGITSMMDAAVRIGGKTVGVVCHEHVGRKRRWTVQDQMFAASIADMVSLTLDRWEQRKAEAALRKSELKVRELLGNKLRITNEKYQTLTDSLPDTLLVACPEGTIRYANGAAETLFGLRPNELIWRSLSGLLPGSVLEQVKKHCHSSRRSIAPLGLETDILHASGRRIPVELKVCHFGKGTKAQCMFILRDITERRALENRWKLYQAIFRHSLEGITITDPDGRYREQNPAHRELYGYSDEEFRGKTPALLMGEIAFTEISERLSHGKNFRGEITTWRKGGKKIEVDLSAFPVQDESGKTASFIAVKRDISIQKQAAEALKLYREIFRNSQEAIAILDLRGRYLEQNDCHRRLFGYTDDELARQVPTSILKSGFYASMAQELARQGHFHGETSGNTKAGSRIELDLSAFTVRDTERAPVCYVTVTRDITEKNRILETVRHSREQFQALFEQVGVGIAQVELDGRMVQVNQKLCDILGYTRGELTGKFTQELTHPADLERTQASFRQLQEADSHTLQFEKRFIHKNGSAVWVQLDAVLALDGAGKPRNAIGVIQDITERKKAEEQLRLMASITSASAEGIVVLDEDQRIVFWNEAAERIHGYTAEEVLGKSARELLVPPDRVEESQRFAILKPDTPGETIVGFRTERLHKSGERIPVSMTTFTIRDGTGAGRRRVVIFQDMSRETEMQARLMEQSNMAAIGELAANIAHEIRNPLFAISSVAQVLAREAPAHGETRELADSMLEEIVRLNQLLKGILLFSKPATVKRRAVNPRKLFGELTEFHQADLDEKRLRLDFAFDPPEKAVAVDEEQMKQVVRNLILNAIQASPEGDTIKVRSLIEKGGWRFEIQNGGEPIDPKTIGSVFKPFFSTKKGGVGLGLSISRKIVEAHGGTIRCASRPAEGTTFRVEIPPESVLTGSGDYA
ncbi:MAG: PAS domain S-box protein [Pseudomonadota bacterium]